jgi:hypothetical protein
MFDPQADAEQRKALVASQIIVAALFVGCLFFLLIVLLIVPSKLGGWELGPGRPLSLAALVMAFGILGARAIVPGVATAQMLRRFASQESGAPEWKGLFGVYQATLIIKVAMLEGVVFMLLIAHMVERSPWTLSAAVVLLTLLLLHMPTPRRVDDWIERQAIAVGQQRGL